MKQVNEYNKTETDSYIQRTIEWLAGREKGEGQNKGMGLIFTKCMQK